MMRLLYRRQGTKHLLKVVAIALLISCSSTASDTSQEYAKSITGAEGVFAVFTFGGRTYPPNDPQLIFAIWDDGKMVWSGDELRGGAPYRSAEVSSKDFTQLLARLDRDGFFADQTLSGGNVVMGGPFIMIVVKSRGKTRLQMAASYELFEAGGKMVGTAHGVTLLNGRRRVSVLREQPAEYLYQRLAWSELRAIGARLIPSTSTAIKGRLMLNDDGSIAWIQEDARM